MPDTKISALPAADPTEVLGTDVVPVVVNMAAGTKTTKRFTWANLANKVSALLGLGTAATRNVPASGDAAAGEVVKGDDTRLGAGGAAGADGQLQANSGGALGGLARVTWDAVAAALTVACDGGNANSRVAVTSGVGGGLTATFCDGGTAAAAAFGDGTRAATLANGSQAGSFTDGVRTVYVCNGSFAIEGIGAGGFAAIGTAAYAIDASGPVRLVSLPTSDPGVSGALWNDAGTLKISP